MTETLSLDVRERDQKLSLKPSVIRHVLQQLIFQFCDVYLVVDESVVVS
jgi:hypothetical protein